MGTEDLKAKEGVRKEEGVVKARFRTLANISMNSSDRKG